MFTLRIFAQLIQRDLLIFKKQYLSKITDILLTFITWVVVFGYFVPKMGTQSSYGVYIMVGAIASFGIFEIIGQTGILINDIQGDRTISYLLLLPVRTPIIFLYQSISWSLQSFFIAIPLYIIGKALFWNEVPLSGVSWVQFSLALVSLHLFLGAFSLFLVSILYKLRDLNQVYFRFLNPLFILGCYFYTWHVAYELSPWIGYALFIDPFTYMMEMIRAAILGPEGYLPFWSSFSALWGFTLVLGTFAVYRLKKVLDCL